MKKYDIMAVALSTVLAALAIAPTAHASSVRTFVASTGVDSNSSQNCSRTAPCRTLSAAYPVTQTGGEIIALDAAGYGSVSINTAVTIVGVDAAFVAVSTGSTGISVSANTGDLVILRNIQISGAGSANSTGVALNSGRLVMHNVSLRSLTTGLSVTNAKADVVDSEIIGNTTGIVANGTGVNFNNFPLTGPTQVRLARGSVVDNTTAYVMNNPGNNSQSIIEYLTDNSTAAFSTWQAGNATLVSGSGTGCPCSAIGATSTGVNFNLN